ncbi:hypothetical protein GS446_25300 [Rhodococcus hoagii]|nr:hypothetical protein [Prescottella equi]
MFSGEIKNWNDEAIAAQNEGVELPDTPITVVHRSDDSGTTENFTAYLTEGRRRCLVLRRGRDLAVRHHRRVRPGHQGGRGPGLPDRGRHHLRRRASAVGELGTVSVKVGEETGSTPPRPPGATVEKSEAKEDGSIELDRATDESGCTPSCWSPTTSTANKYESQETVDQVKAFAEYVVSEDGQKTAEESAGNAPISEDTPQEGHGAHRGHLGQGLMSLLVG